MVSSKFSAVQLANISMLSAIQEAGCRDPRDACLVFNVSEQELSALTRLSLWQILELVDCMGQTCLFSPRTDLLSKTLQVPKVARMLAAGKLSHLHEVRRP